MITVIEFKYQLQYKSCTLTCGLNLAVGMVRDSQRVSYARETVCIVLFSNTVKMSSHTCYPSPEEYALRF